MVKKEEIAKNKIKIYYFKNNQGIFDITEHIIMSEGGLEPAFPKGFYDNSYSLSKELY